MRVRVIYTENYDNADEIFSQPDVNGGLIGGAALDANSFLALIAASEASTKS